MFNPKRYFIILVFFLLVILAMFFIFHNAMKVESSTVFQGSPGWFAKSGCIVRGGMVEELFSGEDLSDTQNVVHVCRFK